MERCFFFFFFFGWIVFFAFCILSFFLFVFHLIPLLPCLSTEKPYKQPKTKKEKNTQLNHGFRWESLSSACTWPGTPAGSGVVGLSNTCQKKKAFCLSSKGEGKRKKKEERRRRRKDGKNAA